AHLASFGDRILSKAPRAEPRSSDSSGFRRDYPCCTRSSACCVTHLAISIIKRKLTGSRFTQHQEVRNTAADLARRFAGSPIAVPLLHRQKLADRRQKRLRLLERRAMAAARQLNIAGAG